MLKTLVLRFCAVAVVIMQSCNDAADNTEEKTGKLDTEATFTLNTLTEEEKNAGWVLLFDGASVNGWHTYGKNTVGSSWKVSDSSLFLDTTKINGQREEGDLITNDEYENFHLSLDWKVAQGAKPGEGG